MYLRNSITMEAGQSNEDLWIGTLQIFIVRLREQNDFITCIIWTNVFVVMFQSFVN